MNSNKQKLLKEYLERKKHSVNKEKLWEELSQSLPIDPATKLFQKVLSTFLFTSGAIILFFIVNQIGNPNIIINQKEIIKNAKAEDSAFLNKQQVSNSESTSIIQKQEALSIVNSSKTRLEKNETKIIQKTEGLAKSAESKLKPRNPKSKNKLLSLNLSVERKANHKNQIKHNINYYSQPLPSTNEVNQTQSAKFQTNLNNLKKPTQNSSSLTENQFANKNKIVSERILTNINSIESISFSDYTLISFDSSSFQSPAIAQVSKKQGMLQLEFNLGVGLSPYRLNVVENDFSNLSNVPVLSYGIKFKYIVERDYFLEFYLQDNRVSQEFSDHQIDISSRFNRIGFNQFSFGLSLGKFFNLFNYNFFITGGPIVSLSRGNSNNWIEGPWTNPSQILDFDALNQELQLGANLEIGKQVTILNQPIIFSLQIQNNFQNLDIGNVISTEDQNSSHQVGYIYKANYNLLFNISYVASF